MATGPLWPSAEIAHCCRYPPLESQALHANGGLRASSRTHTIGQNRPVEASTLKQPFDRALDSTPSVVACPCGVYYGASNNTVTGAALAFVLA